MSSFLLLIELGVFIDAQLYVWPCTLHEEHVVRGSFLFPYGYFGVALVDLRFSVFYITSLDSEATLWISWNT